ncbi:hypothetical protein CMV_022853 [Castanea mollissima]|uniref:TIR domain-containing protein n=1 Tax=Castanea mollissima TaxID=60419 RepID=A0A8J4QUB8_9ROSI|nr:hypothetical protein CMV_022853 [Castanea mollissima]
MRSRNQGSSGARLNLQNREPTVKKIPMVFLTDEGASSSSSTCRKKYDVFLSFRGEDTRTGSKWCLDELVKIVECWENNQMVLLRPIFYNVEPSEVRKQLGNFGIALANHEKEFKEKGNFGITLANHEKEFKEKMQRWREALSKAANVSGSHYQEGRTTYKSEYEFIQGIVEEISSATFNGRPSYDAENLVGINSRVKDIIIWCHEDANKLLTGNKGSDEIRGIMWLPKLFGQGCHNKYLRSIKLEGEWPSSLRYLTKGIIRLEIEERENRGKFLDSTNKLQLLEEIDTPILHSFYIRALYSGFRDDLSYKGILIDLDFWLRNDIFPALRYITIKDSNIVSIPECIFGLSTLKEIYINNCKKLREIQNPRLPQSIREVKITRCPSLLPQSSSRLLNEFGKILGTRLNRVSEVEAHEARNFYVHVFINGRKQYFNRIGTEESYEELRLFYKPTLGQLHKLFEQNQVVVEVEVGDPYHMVFEQNQRKSLKLPQNHFTDAIKWWGVNVECICCPQKPDITYLPLPSDRNGCGSSSVLNDAELSPFQPVFPTSYGSAMDCGAFNNEGDLGNSMEPTNTGFEPGLTNGFDFGFAQPNLELGSGVSSGFHLGSSSMAHASANDDSDFYMGSSSMAHDCFQPVFPTSYGFEPGLKGFLGDLNVSLPAPNNSELLSLLPGPNMDHEVSNIVNDLRLLKGIHNDGCDLSLSLNDSNERESEPPLFPDLTNGFDFGFAQPNLEFGSSVSSGFHLDSSSMAHANVMGSSSMAHDCVNDDSDINMGPPPKKARTS